MFENKKAFLRPLARHGDFYSILVLCEKMAELPQQHTNTVHWL